MGPKYVIVLEFGFLLLNIDNNVEDLVMSNSFRHSVFRQTLVFSSFHTRWMDEKSAVQHLVCQNGVRLWWSPTSEWYSCCWWKKSGDHQLRLVVYPIIYKVLYIPAGCLGFLPSTVSYLSQFSSNGFNCFFLPASALLLFLEHIITVKGSKAWFNHPRLQESCLFEVQSFENSSTSANVWGSTPGENMLTSRDQWPFESETAHWNK